MRPEWLDRAASLLFPRRCLFCGEVVEYGEGVCKHCEPPRPQEPLCARCGGRKEACACTEEQPWAFDAAARALVYDDGVRHAVIALKERPDRQIVEFFAREMLRVLDDVYLEECFDFLTEVPAGAAKLEQAGFNHSELLAAELARRGGVRHRRRVLLRADLSQDQHELGRRERFANALRSYRAPEGLDLRGKHILLVDDVFTTGATVHACALRLRQCGAARVCVLTATGVDKTMD